MASGDSAGAPARRRLGRWSRTFFRAPLKLYDWHLGWLLGHRFLCLTHQGRRSGRRYRTVLEVIGHDRTRGELIVMAGFGPTSDWYRNILAHPAIEIAVGRERFAPTQRILSEPEAEATLAGYERRNWIMAPIVRRTLGRLAGERYDGTAAARARLVRRLPMVAFAPEGEIAR
jgi:deazaflavin-dependent oxidoreductase (nitroreductase family)